MNKYQDIVMPFRPEMMEELQSRNVSVRVDVIRQLDRTNFTPEQAALIFPIAAAQLAKETAKTRKKMLAVLCVKTAEKASDVPGLMECLTLNLKDAKTRNDKHSAFAWLRVASTKGWDISPAVPLLIEETLNNMGHYALKTLEQAARSGIDVLEFDTPDGIQARELFRLTLEMTRSGDTRQAILKILTELVRHRASQLDIFAYDVGQCAADTRMSGDFRKTAAACLAAFRDAGIEPD